MEYKKFLLIPIFAIMCIINTTIAASAIDYPFSFTQTVASDNSAVQVFRISAKGTFYIDCGDGGTLSGNGVVTGTTQIERPSETTKATYTCRYTNRGTKTVQLGGEATGYSTSSNTAAITVLASPVTIYGDLSAIFPDMGSGYDQYPRFIGTFRGKTALESIPDTLFSKYTVGRPYMFQDTFSGCTSLQTIPEPLFVNITGAATSMFLETFSNCTSLQTIPERLFENITDAASGMFYGTFSNCTSLQTLPERLFANITSAADRMFQNTFFGCYNITGYIPPKLFAGLINHNSPKALYMFANTFYYVLKGCPANTTQFITGYESDWGGFVSCEPVSGVPVYTVTYSCGLTDGSAPETTHVAANHQIFLAKNTCSIPSGYSGFDKWKISGTDDLETAETVLVWDYNENKTLTAQYVPNQITVRFDENTTNMCTYGETLNNIPTPAPRPGYVFLGWKKKFTLTSLDPAVKATAYEYKAINDGIQLSYSGCGAVTSSGANSAGLSNGEWMATFSHGTLYGRAYCSDRWGGVMDPEGEIYWPEGRSATWRGTDSEVRASRGETCYCQGHAYAPLDESRQNVSDTGWIALYRDTGCGVVSCPSFSTDEERHECYTEACEAYCAQWCAQETMNSSSIVNPDTYLPALYGISQ